MIVNARYASPFGLFISHAPRVKSGMSQVRDLQSSVNQRLNPRKVSHVKKIVQMHRVSADDCLLRRLYVFDRYRLIKAIAMNLRHAVIRNGVHEPGLTTRPSPDGLYDAIREPLPRRRRVLRIERGYVRLSGSVAP